MSVVSEKRFEEILRKRFYDNSPVKRVKQVYNHNHVYLKKYDSGKGDVKYKLVYMPSVKTSGYEYEGLEDSKERNLLVKAVTRGYEPDNPFLDDDAISYYVHDTKFESSLIRAKSKIFDIAFCNEWEFFFTGTLSSEKVADRSDLSALHKKFSRFVKDFNKNNSINVKFLIVPELHCDNINWHFHGFLMGFSDRFSKFFKSFVSSDILPLKIKDELKKGYEVYSWIQYEKSFGWNYIEPIKNHESVAKYCTKYITKDVLSNVSKVGAHVYYRSRGLRSPDLIKEGTVSMAFVNSIIWDSENEFSKIVDVAESDLENILNFID